MNGTSPQMNKTGQKRRIRLLLFFVLCFSIWTGYTVYLQSGILQQKEAELQSLQTEVAKVQAQQDELMYKASRLNDKEYIAELARKRYNMAKPGEILFVIPEQ
ncbi:FtsB family cell division protein [Brevibacillus fulvus]|uniref:Cell division protein DivIC n=1 Tax=Brevibacillus fulvus TaxID=1125967 RepID=A0A938XXU1_9BACL|nr:septum formation initiator family protein [Brevibacillus fulvus]MBM7592177.1 cell division protein DivIC [Brevibacillus fulvus]